MQKVLPKSFRIDLPQWFDEFCDSQKVFSSSMNDEQAMRLAIALARQNAEKQSGGPFGSVVLDVKTREIIALGVNRVMPSQCSLAHGEMTALSLAQQVCGTYDLASDGRRFALYSSAAPCAMCLGGIVWSGVKELYTAATADDVQGIVGYDEGPVHPHWVAELTQRGISVTTEFLRAEACHVLHAYRDGGGVVYNPS